MTVPADLVPLAYRLVERLTSHYTARLAELGLSRAEAKALLVLEPGGQLPVSVVAERLWADRSNTTSLINRLIARGLIERVAGAEAGLRDGRTRVVSLTPAGLDLRARLMARTAVDSPLLGDLSPDELVTLRDLLARIDWAAAGQVITPISG
ncbi:MarR family transcriptional regulator [Actinoplanes ianthinogenes]|uniref:MarR family transcriptional regulator n=1 Tax=Actinoplanes ianthinogenes TaxID=122358 RepID=A0ABM7M078_9ACTN|nr:MarR family winged helix-turn-helix transcriptional regulator [Actinoplanes ianthinogenes]BCJ44957.1 MarR family transcriptional regulator [Actinoplanes ianthinogenes]GGR52749.1 MarR family transcriptional regulator [Actinoplanes ianthinogenes]